MGRPRIHTAETGELLLNVAERLLTDGGEHKVTVRAVADGADLPVRAVYSVFGSREGLIAGLAIRGYRILADRVNGLPETDDAAADLIAVGLDGFRRFAVDHPALYRLSFERVTAETVMSAEVEAALFGAYDALLRWIRRARGTGMLAGLSDDEVAFGFHALCQGLAAGELSREPPPIGANFWIPVRDLSGERLWRIALDALVTGLPSERDQVN